MITQQDRELLFQCLDDVQSNCSISALAECCLDVDFVSTSYLLELLVKAQYELNQDIDAIRRLSFLAQEEFDFSAVSSI